MEAFEALVTMVVIAWIGVFATALISLFVIGWIMWIIWILVRR